MYLKEVICCQVNIIFIDFTLSTQNSETSFLLNGAMQMGEIQLKIMSTVKITEFIFFFV